MSSCSVCGKTFKNLRLHTVKMHEDIRVKRSSVAGEFYKNVRYAGVELIERADYQSGEEMIITFEFPKGHPFHNYSKFDGIAIAFDDTANVLYALYIKFLDESKNRGEWEEVGKIARDRVLTEL